MTTFFAICPRALEDLLADELEELGAESTRPTRAGVHFEGDLETAYRAVLWSRLANGVLYPISTFPAANEEQLYAGLREIEWDDHFGVEQTFAVTFNSRRSAFDHSHYGALKSKDAICDYYREIAGARPSVDTDEPDIRINVYVDRQEATASIDISGASLHRRGYRVSQVAAPLKENVAASILVRGGWNQHAAQGNPFVDPFCGSGTLAIEAALMAGDIAPGLTREEFGFDRWRGHDYALWKELEEEARERAEAGRVRIPSIFAYDVSAKAIRATHRNVKAAGLDGTIVIDRQDVSDLVPPLPGPGLICTNPPYGERIGDDAPAIHRAFGDRLIQHFEGWQAAVLTGSKELGYELGLRATKVTNVDNGPIACVLLNFDVTRDRVFKERR